jgi:hypothetical protein
MFKEKMDITFNMFNNVMVLMQILTKEEDMPFEYILLTMDAFNTNYH